MEWRIAARTGEVDHGDVHDERSIAYAIQWAKPGDVINLYDSGNYETTSSLGIAYQKNLLIKTE